MASLVARAAAAAGRRGAAGAARRALLLPLLPARRRLAGKAARSAYRCDSCGAAHLKWSGSCAACGEWNTLVEDARAAAGGSGGTGSGAAAAPDPAASNRVGWVGASGRPSTLAQVGAAAGEAGGGPSRLSLGGAGGLADLGQVLGGGLVPGSLLLLGGDPGIGKSTLALQLAAELARSQARPVLYVSGEETVGQLRLRARRLGVADDEPNLRVWNENHVESVLEEAASLRPCLMVVDSVQTVYTEASQSAMGSVVQVRESASRFLRLAKSCGVATVLVGHVNKSGELAGPRVLEHLVDTVLYVEGEALQSHRVVRATKNRFGSCNEVAVLEMGERGLSRVENPSLAFLSAGAGGGEGGVGSAVTAALEGSRTMMVEIQALLAPKHAEFSRHRCNGLDADRFHLLLAVLGKFARVPVAGLNVFANVVGGLRLDEPASDLALVVAALSSHLERPVPPHTAFVGEVGLSGEVRPVAQLDRRVREASRLGFRRLLVPQLSVERLRSSLKPDRGLELVGVASVSDLHHLAFRK